MPDLRSPMIADEAERALALDPTRSFIVQAPAGSGKTELLVRRYVRLLDTVKRPEEILALTFTRKAAAEMRKRVLREVPALRDIAQRLRIQTIDALCASLSRRMPVLSRFGAPPEVIEDAREHYRAAAERALADLAPPAATFLAHVDNDVSAAVRLLASMLAKRDQWLGKTGAMPAKGELESAFRAERKRLLDAAGALDSRASEEFAREVLTKEGAWRKKSATAQSLSSNEPLRRALCWLLEMPPASYTDEQWGTLEAILKLLRIAAAHLTVVFGERGETDFTEVSQAALRALGTSQAPSDLLLALDYRIRHVLVDEFQDTSTSQWELLERLSAGWEPGDGRTLFLVGDPMQSIYRFRQAQIGLFLRARREGIGEVALEPLALSTNFRSQANLVRFFNGAFARVFPERDDETSGAVAYSPAHAREPALPGEAVTWHACADRGAEAERVVSLVQQAKDRPAILVRNRSDLAHIVPALKEKGIPFRAVEIEHLGEKQGVQDLYALTRALSHLADRIAWLSILRAPWCALTLADLNALVACSDPGELVFDLLSDLSHLSPEGRARAERLREAVGAAIADRSRGTLRERVECVWLALGGPACVESVTELEDAEAYLDELEALEHAGELEDFGALAGALSELYALPDVDATDDDLQIMTVHRAKGLEFGTVIVPGLDRSPGRSDPPLFLWKARPDGALLVAPIKETGSDGDPAYEYLRRLESAAEDSEAARLLYVAATRAEHALHFLARATHDKDGELRAPVSRSLLAYAWPVAEEHFAKACVAAAQPVDPGPLRKRHAALKRLALDAAAIVPPAGVRWTPPSRTREESAIEFSWAGEAARHAGTVAHRWLQTIAEDELRGWDTRRVDRMRSLLKRQLLRRGVQSIELDAAADIVASALKNALGDERGRWILGPHAEARSEYRFRMSSPSGVSTYVVDRVFSGGDGKRWVIDYKTSRHEGADTDAFLDRERGRYESQLNAYGKALQVTHAGLYFPLLRGWRSWQLASSH